METQKKIITIFFFYYKLNWIQSFLPRPQEINWRIERICFDSVEVILKHSGHSSQSQSLQWILRTFFHLSLMMAEWKILMSSKTLIGSKPWKNHRKEKQPFLILRFPFDSLSSWSALICCQSTILDQFNQRIYRHFQRRQSCSFHRKMVNKIFSELPHLRIPRSSQNVG